MTHPSESGRFYWPDGRPAYEVQGAKGMVAPDIRHAKKLGLLPSVTTIIGEAAKPGLEHWKVRQGILSALTLPQNEGESLDAFADRVMLDSKEQAKKAAERGTAIHAAIQDYYETGSSILMPEYVLPVEKALMDWATVICDLYPEKSFASPLGFAGKVDLSGEHYVLDFKTKEFADTDKKLAWDEHCIQLSAYRVGLDLPDAVCANVFVSVNNPGLVHIHEWTEEQLQRGWKMFCALKDYYYARTGLQRA